MIDFKLLTQCRLCGNIDLKVVVDLGIQHLSGIFPKDVKADLNIAPLALVKCNDKNGCGHVQLNYSCNPSQMYGDNYGYRSGLNSSMVKHLADKKEYLSKLVHLSAGDIVVDIAGNDGTFLSFFDSSLNLLSIDPTAEKFSIHYPNHVKYESTFFSIDIVRKRFGDLLPKLITTFSMFYDLEDPVNFSKDIYEILDPVSGIWSLEMSYMPEMVATNSFDTICHEHLSYFSLKQLKYIFDLSNLKIIDFNFNKINGGSIAINVARHGSKYLEIDKKVKTQIQLEEKLGFTTLYPWENFNRNIIAFKEKFIALIREELSNGKRVAALGASTKGNVTLQTWGLNQDFINVIGDVNLEKVNRITPGTHIPIKSEDFVLKQGYECLVILPWHFREFFVSNSKFANKTLIFPLPFPEKIST